jgi:hypothetical protein
MNQAAGEGISYRDSLPLRWLPLEAVPVGAESERLADTNARLLMAVALLEEHVQPADEPSQAELELQRIHLKLNLLLELFGNFINLQTPRPAVVALRLSWQGASWASAEPPPLGTVGLLELHLCAALPQPLRWPARIIAVGAGEVSAEFEAVPDFCQAALERHVFQRHRRAIKETRQPATPQG